MKSTVSLEAPIFPLPSPRAVIRDFSFLNAVNATVAFIFSASGPVAITLAIGTKAGLSESDLASWLFGGFFLNGLISIIFCLLYRQPLVIFWTIPGIVLLGPALEHLSFPEVVGAFYGTGLLMIVLGLSGWVRRAMKSFPMPIVMAMVAGVFLQFGLGLIGAFGDGLWIAAPMTLTFLVVTAMPALARRLQPLIAALVVGVGAIFLLGAFSPGTDMAVALAAPRLVTPVFSWPALVELVVPLAITVLVVQNGQGFAILDAAGHRPPINSITVVCGAGSIITALVGTVPTCLTGPVNAIISSGGEKSRHYTAGIMVGLYALLFGLFASFFTHLMLATPAAFIATLAGLAMLRVLQGAFVVAFGGRFTLGALVTFLITVSDISIYNIGAPFWGLAIGFVVSRFLERDDFQTGP